MSKKKYTPQAGDVCEWNDKEVLIISPEPTEKGCFIAYEEIDFIDKSLDLVWHCELSKLKLIYQP